MENIKLFVLLLRERLRYKQRRIESDPANDTRELSSRYREGIYRGFEITNETMNDILKELLS